MLCKLQSATKILVLLLVDLVGNRYGRKRTGNRVGDPHKTYRGHREGLGQAAAQSPHSHSFCFGCIGGYGSEASRAGRLGSRGTCSVGRRQAGHSSRAMERKGGTVPGLATKPTPSPLRSLSLELALQRHLGAGGEPRLEGDPRPQKKSQAHQPLALSCICFIFSILWTW